MFFPDVPTLADWRSLIRRAPFACLSAGLQSLSGPEMAKIDVLIQQYRLAAPAARIGALVHLKRAIDVWLNENARPSAKALSPGLDADPYGAVEALDETVVRRLKTAMSGMSPLCQMAHPQMGQAFDRRHGVQTAANIPLRAFAVDPRNAAGGNAYQPANEDDLETAIERLRIDFKRFRFIDLGCGKGKALIVASKFNFRALIGVELIEDLAQAAEKNLRRLRIDNARIYNMDVRSFRFSGSHILIFMFNPFDAEIMAKVLENLKINKNSEIWIIYHVAVHSVVLERSGFLRKIAEFRGSRSKLLTQIWSRFPPPTAAK